MLSNIMGPILDVYLLSCGLGRFGFVGVRAWFFLAVNAVKIPMQVHSGNIDGGAVGLGGAIGVVAVLGCVVARPVLVRLPQRVFEGITWFFVGSSALKLFLAG
jgi:hypothetical protein